MFSQEKSQPIRTVFAACPSAATRSGQRALQQALRCTLEGAITYEADLQEVAVRSTYFRQGADAFLNERLPHFKGRLASPELSGLHATGVVANAKAAMLSCFFHCGQ